MDAAQRARKPMSGSVSHLRVVGRDGELVSAEQLRELIRHEVRAAIAESLTNRSQWMSREEVAEMLGYKVTYICELVTRRGLPCHRIGRKMRFKRSEVLEWAGVAGGNDGEG